MVVRTFDPATCPTVAVTRSLNGMSGDALSHHWTTGGALRPDRRSHRGAVGPTHNCTAATRFCGLKQQRAVSATERKQRGRMLIDCRRQGIQRFGAASVEVR